MTGKQWNDLVERTAHTFWEGAIAATPVIPLSDWSGLKEALFVAASGGIAAVLAAARAAAKNHRTPV
jgi:hypothetical protein